MAAYKVSYKILAEQGSVLKAVSKEVSAYVDRLNTVKGKLGDDQLLGEIRQNLGKLAQDLSESQAFLTMAGELLVQSVDGYSTVETNVVKKTGETRASKRDFYKNPVSAGGSGGIASTVYTAGSAGTAAGSAAAAGSAGPAPSSAGRQVSYVDQSVNLNISGGSFGTGQPSQPVPEMVKLSAAGQAAAAAGGGTGAAAMVGAAIAGAAAGAAAGAGGVAAALKMTGEKKSGQEAPPEAEPLAPAQEDEGILEQAQENKGAWAQAQPKDKPQTPAQDGLEDLEAQLEAAKKRLEALNAVQEEEGLDDETA